MAPYRRAVRNGLFAARAAGRRPEGWAGIRDRSRRRRDSSAATWLPAPVTAWQPATVQCHAMGSKTMPQWPASSVLTYSESGPSSARAARSRHASYRTALTIAEVDAVLAAHTIGNTADYDGWRRERLAQSSASRTAGSSAALTALTTPNSHPAT